MSATGQYDVIVVGGGPAGSTVSALLAQQGWKVLVLEKSKFPRYHIGESMLPYSYFVLQRLGMLEKMQQSHFTKKFSVQFVSMSGKASQPFYFDTHMNHPAAQTWQVVRSEFDQMMLDNAREKGAEVMEETAAREIIEEGSYVAGVKAEGKDGTQYEFHAPMTIDCSGIDNFAMKKHKWRLPDAKLNKVAVWTYYEGAMRDEGKNGGATTVAYVPEKGWFWYIPLHNDIVSVGIVAEPSYLYRDGRDPEKMFLREIENNAWIREHLSVGRNLHKYHHTGDYSYRSKFCARDGMVLVGDAFAFLDPLFSSGVFLALRGGELAADAVDKALREKDYRSHNFADYSEKMCQGIEAMRSLVYAFYDPNFNFRKLINAHPNLHGDVTDVLIGNLLIDFEPLFKAVREFAMVPDPLPHGKPLVA